MPSSQTTIKLREECKKAGIRGYYKMSNEEMELKLRASKPDTPKRTNAQLREECKKVGIKGYYKMSNEEMELKLEANKPGAISFLPDTPKKTNIQLREECKKAGIKGYYKMSNKEMEAKLKVVEEDLRRKRAEMRRKKQKSIFRSYGF